MLASEILKRVLPSGAGGVTVPAGGVACLGDVLAGGEVVAGGAITSGAGVVATGATLGGIHVTGPAAFDDTLSVDGQLSTASNMLATGNVVAGGDVSGDNVAATAGNVTATGNVAATGDVTGANIPAAPSTDTAGGNQQTLTASSLSGTNKTWRLRFFLVTAAAQSGDLTVRPNNSSADGQSTLTFDGTSAGETSNATLQLGDNATGAGVIAGWLDLQQVNTQAWIYTAKIWQLDGANVFQVNVSGRWNQVAALTSIVIHHTNAAGLRTGSSIRWQQVTP